MSVSFDINDPKNVIGLASLMDDNDENMLSLEKEILSGGCEIEQEEEDLLQEYQKGMDRLNRDFNTKSNHHHQDDDDDRDEPEQTTDYNYSSYNSEPNFLPPIQSQPKSNVYSSHSSVPSYSFAPSNSSTPSNSYGFERRKPPEKEQDFIDDVIGGLDTTDAQSDDEDEDLRMDLINQIDIIRTSLEDASIDIQGVPKVSEDMSIREMQKIKKLLENKSDKHRWCTVFEEILLMSIQGLENVFNGKTEIFGRYPDLTGFSQHAKIKIRRMRPDTSRLVKEVLDEYSIPIYMRLALEIMPAMFLYSRQRQLATNSKDSLNNDIEYKNAISDLNSQLT